MTETHLKKSRLGWLGVLLLAIGFVEFVFLYLLKDQDALTSSVYTYYQHNYYVHLSKGELPWIDFQIEYPPLAAYALIFPALFSGLSVFWVSYLRGLSTLALSILTLKFLRKCDRITPQIQDIASIAFGSMACIVPGFYFGLFDWTLAISNVLMALLLFGRTNQPKDTKQFWPLVFGGAAIKLMPLLAIPFLIQVKALREKSNFWLSMSVATLIHVPFVVFGFANFKAFVVYHKMRSIDCFSTYACILNAMEQLGLASVVRSWKFGALEVEGSYSSIFAKASLPLFILILIGLIAVTNRLMKRGFGVNAAFGMYLVAFLVYPAISKVSQSNYCIWTVSCLICFWLIGFQRKRFVQFTGLAVVAILIIGFVQDRYFVDFTLPLVPWFLIIVSTIRQILTVVLAVFCYREVLGTKLQESPG